MHHNLCLTLIRESSKNPKRENVNERVFGKTMTTQAMFSDFPKIALGDGPKNSGKGSNMVKLYIVDMISDR